ncbi:hypothetical protein R3P38DRAFT_3277624 [Favolaschia claudopus]|uniref:Uncharacterized protein n=1 Tax=Favolaschia claudopus TaxID=2862362 RepID=A0AAW0ALR4_9AGAR
MIDTKLPKKKGSEELRLPKYAELEIQLRRWWLKVKTKTGKPAITVTGANRQRFFSRHSVVDDDVALARLRTASGLRRGLRTALKVLRAWSLTPPYSSYQVKLEDDWANLFSRRRSGYTLILEDVYTTTSVLVSKLPSSTTVSLARSTFMVSNYKFRRHHAKSTMCLSMNHIYLVIRSHRAHLPWYAFAAYHQGTSLARRIARVRPFRFSVLRVSGAIHAPDPRRIYIHPNAPPPYRLTASGLRSLHPTPSPASLSRSYSLDDPSASPSPRAFPRRIQIYLNRLTAGADL